MGRTLAQVTALYSCLAEGTISERLVWDDDAHRFSTALSRLREGVGEDELLVPMLRKANRLRFDLMAAPVSPRSLDPDEVHAQMRRDRVAIEAALPHLREALDDAIEALEVLAQSTANPLLDAAAAIAEGAPGAIATVLLRESRLIGPSQAAASDAGIGTALRWMTPHELRAADRADTLVVIGAPAWFPTHVFAAPRAPAIHAVRHRWITADWRRLSKPAFEVSALDQAVSAHRPPTLRRAPSPAFAGVPTSIVAEADLLPAWDVGGWDQDRASFPDWSSDDEVDALALRLEGDEFVLMEDADGHRALIADLDEDAPVRRVPVRDLTPGVFVLLRTEGGGDYVVEVADRVLGAHAATAREAQRLWKTKLRDAVRARGAEAIVAELRRTGSQVANESNLRNWLSPRNIRTRRRIDFDAILAATDLVERREELWREMTLIAKAHTRAGQVIRRQLLAEVERADPQEMIRRGRLDVELDEGGGALTAVRVEEVLPGRRKVLRSQLDRLLAAS